MGAVEDGSGAERGSGVSGIVIHQISLGKGMTDKVLILARNSWTAPVQAPSKSHPQSNPPGAPSKTAHPRHSRTGTCLHTSREHLLSLLRFRQQSNIESEFLLLIKASYHCHVSCRHLSINYVYHAIEIESILFTVYV